MNPPTLVLGEITLLPMAHFAGRPSGTNKRRLGISRRGLKVLLTLLSHARPKNKTRPSTLTLFDIVPLNTAKGSSRLSVCAEPSSSFPREQVSVHSPGPSRPTRRYLAMADRIVDVRLESIYEEDEIRGGYVFAAALQDVWHAQDIEAYTSTLPDEKPQPCTLIFLIFSTIPSTGVDNAGSYDGASEGYPDDTGNKWDDQAPAPDVGVANLANPGSSVAARGGGG
ncbi:hypothetical protein FRC10_009666 [Ceratobasidium sp. 414]|nr:hypothetical protein FRC10_009666 [Ceratobasidium sp. 414]